MPPYDTTYELSFLDPATTAVLRVAPTWAFAMREDDFSGSPTRWRFQRPDQSPVGS